MRDNISSLMDGELDKQRCAGLIEQIGHDEEARQTWAIYHLIGDTLRGDGHYRSGLQERINAKLTEEATVLAPKPSKRFKPMRIAMAIAASVLTFSVVVWLAGQEADTPVRTAQSNPPALVTAGSIEPASAGVYPANLNEYLLAHEEFSPYTAGYRFANVSSIAPAGGANGK